MNIKNKHSLLDSYLLIFCIQNQSKSVSEIKGMIQMIFFFLTIQICYFSEGCHLENECNTEIPSDASKVQQKDGPYNQNQKQSLCVETNGQWLECLQTCDCPQDQLFSSINGCTYPNRIPHDKLEKISYIGSLTTNASLTDLRGLTFQDSITSKDKISIMIQDPIRPKNITKELESTLNNPPRERLITYTSTHQRESNASRGLLKCFELFDKIDQKQALKLQAMCIDLWLTVNNIKNGTACIIHPLTTKQWGPKNESVNEINEISFFYANLETGTLRYKIEGIPDIPVVRTIEIGNSSESSIEFLISPLGELFAGKFSIYQMASKDDPYVVEQHTFYFDSSMEIIDVHKKYLGQRQLLREAAQAKLEQDPNSIKIKTDGNRTTLYKPIQGMIIEAEPVNLISRTTLSRIVLNPEKIYNIAHLNDFDDIFSSNYIYKNWDPFMAICEPNTCSHATAVISLMARDLPFSRITTFSSYNHSMFPAKESILYESLIKKINLEKPRVVNISCNFLLSIQDCDYFLVPSSIISKKTYCSSLEQEMMGRTILNIFALVV